MANFKTEVEIAQEQEDSSCRSLSRFHKHESNRRILHANFAKDRKNRVYLLLILKEMKYQASNVLRRKIVCPWDEVRELSNIWTWHPSSCDHWIFFVLDNFIIVSKSRFQSDYCWSYQWYSGKAQPTLFTGFMGGSLISTDKLTTIFALSYGNDKTVKCCFHFPS